jgi:hypothetical protein
MNENKDNNTKALIQHMIRLCDERLADMGYAEIWADIKRNQDRLVNYLNGDIVTRQDNINGED